MPTQTLLDMTQEILSSLSSDEVNSIGDTTESMQVATIIRRKYFDIVSRSSLPEHQQLFQLNPSLDITKPVLMYVPDEVNFIEWIKYFDTNVLDGTDPSGNFQHDLNVDLVPTTDVTPAAPGYLDVKILPNDEFINYIVQFNPNDPNVESFVFTDSSSGVPSAQTFYYLNNCQPRFCTIISNHFVVFDCFDSSQDDTLQSSKTMCMGYVAPKFLMEDSFVPDMDDKQFPLLMNEAKRLAFFELKQSPHQLADQEAKRQWSSLQKNKSVDNKPSYFDQLADFGRRGPTGKYSSWYRVNRSW